MKKLLLSFACASSIGFASAQSVAGLNEKAVYDDFLDANPITTDVIDQYGYVSTETGWDVVAGAPTPGTFASTGIYWTESDGKNLPFVAAKSRLGDGKIKYTITQGQGKYEPFLVVLGSYAKNGTTESNFTIDLSANAMLTFKVKNAGTKRIRFSIQVQDLAGNTLVYKKEAGADKPNFYNYNLGFTQGTSLPLAAGATGNYSYDLKDALVGTQPGNVVHTDIAFDYTKVRAVLFTAVDDAATVDYQPLAITNYPIEISEFKLGDVSTIVAGITTENVASTSDEVVSVYDIMGKPVASGKMKELNLEIGKLYVVKSGNKSRKIILN